MLYLAKSRGSVTDTAVAGVRKVPRYQRRACKEKLKKFKKVLDKAGGWWYNKVKKKEREEIKMKKWYEIQTKYYTFPFFMLPLYPIAWIREKIIEKRG